MYCNTSYSYQATRLLFFLSSKVFKLCYKQINANFRARMIFRRSPLHPISGCGSMICFGPQSNKRAHFEKSLISLSYVVCDTRDNEESFFKDKWCDAVSYQLMLQQSNRTPAKNLLPLCLLCCPSSAPHFAFTLQYS